MNPFDLHDPISDYFRGGVPKMVGFPNNHSIFLLNMWSSLGVYVLGGTSVSFSDVRPVVRSPAPLSTQPQPFAGGDTQSAQCFDPCEINVFFLFSGEGFDAETLSFLLFMSFFFRIWPVTSRESAESFWRMFNFEKELGQCSISGVSSCFSPNNYIYICIYTYAWNPKQPFINGCFNWMIPNLYIENGCFTQHPFINGCLGFQVYIEFYLHDVQIQNCRKKEDDWSWLMLSPGSAFFNSMPSELSSSTAMNLGRGSKKEVGNGTIWI